MKKKITQFLENLKDDAFLQKFLENYNNNQEFCQLIDKIFEKNKPSVIEKKKILFEKYWSSFALCINSETNCLQDIPGFRYFLTFENNFLFWKLKKCPHQSNLSSLDTNYLIADFPHQWLTQDLKKKVLFLEDKERNQLMSYFTQFLNWKKPTTTKSLLLTGGLNTGKTFLTLVFANSLIAKQQKKVAFVNAVHLFTKFIDSRKYNLIEKEAFSQFFNQLKKADLLVIDDLGSEKLEKYYNLRDDFLLPLLTHRYNLGLLTVLISNFSYSNLKNFYTYSGDKIEALKSKNFFNLIEKNSLHLVLSKIVKNNGKIDGND